MADRENNDLNPDNQPDTHSSSPTQSFRTDLSSLDRESLLVEIVRRNGLVDEATLSNAEAAYRCDHKPILERLVDQGAITTEQKFAVEVIAISAMKDGRAVDQSLKDTQAPSTPMPLASDTISFRPGRSSNTEQNGLFGDYEILEEIAKGGMGVLHKARHAKLNRVVALKLIRSGELADEGQIKRFYTEAEAAAKLDHSGIVPVYDVGQVDDQHYYSMAFIDGRSLNDRVKDEGPLPPEQAARIIRDAARAVEQAHQSKVLHRDLKPHNILLDTDGQPKVTDFGLAKLQQSDAEMTATGQVLGTPAYMPPEQAAGKMHEVGVSADVYSLGASFYFTLTGRPPFQSANVTDTLRQVMEDEPLGPRQLTPSISRDLETICLKAMRKETDKRYDSAEGMADDIDRWLSGEPIRARRVSKVERAWKWCKRKPVLVGSIATIVALLVIGSIVFWERQNATHVDGLVNSLVNADPAQVPPLVEELDQYLWWSESRLRKRLDESREGSTEELHLSLALLASDPDLAKGLLDVLLTTPERAYVGVIRSALLEANADVEETCWSRFRNANVSDSERFRAGVVLAGLTPTSEQWTKSDYRRLVDELAGMNAIYQPLFWPLLANVEDQLLPPLEALYVNRDRTESEQLAAANAISYFAERDAERLAKLLMIGNGPQYNILYEKYREVVDDQTRSRFTASVSQQPTENMEVADRITLGKERATSAITLLRLGEQESIPDILRFKDDPEAMTQFVHRCKARGVTPSELIGLFEETDQRRGPLDGNREKLDDSVMYALLLALGEFNWNELPNAREALVQRLAGIYENDPSSGVHSATGWLLRKWEQHEIVDRVDRTPLSYDPTGHREWYVQAIEYDSGRVGSLSPEKDKLYLTFIVFPPAEFTMGPTENEPHRGSEEIQLQVRFLRPIAICDRELTWAQWMAMEGTGRHDAYEGQFSKTLGEGDPVFGVSWFEAAYYCRWLSKKAGISEEDQCYSDPSSLPKDGDGNPIEWPLRLDGAGFRLPTEAEWEYICRSGTRTARSCGTDEQLLDHYAWYLNNSTDWSHAAGELRPNVRGLFDIHGNVMEWCHDWHNESELSDATDPLGAESGRFKVCRGGSWNHTAPRCRSSLRTALYPSNRDYFLGFRLATSLPSPTPEAEKATSEPDSEEK